jgi:transcriptional regulator with XRE-family HTH domain
MPPIVALLSTIVSTDLTASIAGTVRAAREAQGLSANALAERSGVSRAMIAKVERAEAQPTAALLGRLSAALGLTLSELVARAERSDRRLARAAEQPTWTDPETGYRRRALSPVSGGPLELVEVELPDGVEIAYPADSYAFIHQQIWMLDGSLAIEEEGVLHELAPGDCLEFGAPSARTFTARTACRYLVALTRRV